MIEMSQYTKGKKSIKNKRRNFQNYKGIITLLNQKSTENHKKLPLG